jgi:acyl-CoA thioesterase-1
MVSKPSGLLTCLVRFSTLRTKSRLVRAWALGVCCWLIVAIADAAGAPERTILVLGDSLSAGYGIKPAQGWVALLEQRLRDQGYGYRVVNASVSGETSGGGLQRLPRTLELHQPAVVIVELGANDGLRGLSVPLTRDNLTKIVTESKQAGARVLLIGMRLPPNYGPRYTNDFMKMYRDVATGSKVSLVPFLLQSVALNPELMQDDGLHPTAPAQPALLDTVWPQLKPLLKKR